MKLDEKTLREAVRAADRRYYDLVQRMAEEHRAKTAACKGRHIMKTIGKLAIGIAGTAVLLVGGGIAAIVALRGSNGGYHDYSSEIQSMLDSAKNSSSQSESSVNEITGTVIVPLDLPLTEQAYAQGTCFGGLFGDESAYSPSESGWFFREHGMERNGKYLSPIFYSDTEEGKCVFFCARPNCLHDGNEYCISTTTAYTLCAEPVWLDGYLYALALKPAGKNISPYAGMGSEGYSGAAVLLRYAPNGSEITEIAEIIPKTEENVMLGINRGSLIAHRGQLWYSFSGIRQNTDTQTQTAYYNMGVYSPQNNTAIPLLTDESPRTYYFSEKGSPVSLRGDGDWVYFCFDAAGQWDDGNKLRTGIWRISCVTGELQKVYSCTSAEMPQQYYVCGDKIVLDVMHETTGEPDAAKRDYLLYDMKEDRTTLIWGAETETDAAGNPGFQANQDGMVWLITEGDFNEDTFEYRVDAEIWFSDWEGNIQKVRIPSDLDWQQHADELREIGQRKENQDTMHNAVYSLMLYDGKVYVNHTLYWYSIPLDDLLNGSTEWQTAFRNDNALY